MALEHFDSIFGFVVVIAGVSLLVTTLTQMIAALFGLRGTHLSWGIKTLLSNLDPDLAQYADRISAEVLRHPLISDSTFSKFAYRQLMGSGPIAWLLNRPNVLLGRFKLATAIRKEELARILLLLANPPAAAPGAAAIEPWRAALAQALQKINPQTDQVLALAAPELQKLFPGAPAQADQLLAQMKGAVGNFSRQIEQWFDSVMDRVSERFALHMRLWTVLFSVVIAFALHLDAFKLFQQISADAELRARLVASAEGLSKKADEILVTGTNAPAAVYIEAMRQLVSLHTNQFASTNIGGFTDLAGGEQWLTNRLVAAKIVPLDPWLREYEALVPGAKLSTAAENLHSILNDQMKFQLIPNPYPKSISSFWTPSWLHFWGIAASAALLSLGAPFWFNMLKTLSNLRPVVANKEDKKAIEEVKK